MKAEILPYTLKFAFTAHTSRETFTEKPTYIIRIFETENPAVKGSGEIAVFPSLQPSFKSWKVIEETLNKVAGNIEDYVQGKALPQNSAIRFGIESALADLAFGGEGYLYPSEILDNINDGIEINGLVWMNDYETMSKQISEKISLGFKCLKLKIGAINFEDELSLIRDIRSEYRSSDLVIRVDANGAFSKENVFSKLEALSRYDIHSIEQPLPRDSEFMREVCRNSPIAVALDEDMIERWWPRERKYEWLGNIAPQYIVVKPSLIGGFEAADEWIGVAEERGVGWWATSALESNIGLSAITQWLATHPEALTLPQGLGTGHIYINNLSGNTELKSNKIYLKR